MNCDCVLSLILSLVLFNLVTLHHRITTSTLKALRNCERMVLANFIGNMLSTFNLWCWLSTCTFYLCTNVLLYILFLPSTFVLWFWWSTFTLYLFTVLLCCVLEYCSCWVCHELCICNVPVLPQFSKCTYIWNTVFTVFILNMLSKLKMSGEWQTFCL